MRKSLVLILVATLITLTSAVDLPDAPSATRKPIVVKHQTVTPPQYEAFSERHRKSIIIGGFVLGAIVGTIIGLLKHSGSCPSRIFYDGKWYPYTGTYDDQHPCPIEPPGVDPEPGR